MATENDEGQEASYRLQARRLSETMKTTAGCRFIAAKRLEIRDQALTRLTAFTSAYVIILTALPYFLKTSVHVTDIINFFTIGCAIVILISSLLQYSNNAVANAEQHHRSGLEINEIRREFEIGMDLVDEARVMATSSRYNSVLQKYSVNHDDIDYMKYQYERPESHPWLTGGKRFRVIVTLWYQKYVPSVTLVVLSALVLATLIGSGSSYWSAGSAAQSPAPPVAKPADHGVTIRGTFTVEPAKGVVGNGQ
jgi:hypothetical protein